VTSRVFEELLTHMEWADALTWRRISETSGAPRDPRLLDLMYHLHTVQWVYLQVWRGEPLHVPARGEFAEAAALSAWARRYYDSLRSFSHELASLDLTRRISLPWADEVLKRLGSAKPATFGETILQVVFHGTYHRGQTATRIRELGGEPPLTDFIAWVWLGKPAPAWLEQ